MQNLLVNIKKQISLRLIHNRQSGDPHFVHKELYLRPVSVHSIQELQTVNDLFLTHSWLDSLAHNEAAEKYPKRWIFTAEEIRNKLEPSVKSIIQKTSQLSLSITSESIGQILYLRSKYINPEVSATEMEAKK